MEHSGYPSIFEYVDNIDGASPDDVWAVGARWHGLYGSSFYAEHWDGRTWRKVSAYGTTGQRPLPPSSSEELTDVAVLSAGNAWAVGTRSLPYGEDDEVILRWNGQAWSEAGGAGVDGDFAAIEALGPDDIWAVGSSPAGTLAEHWDGQTWEIVPTPAVGGDRGSISDVSMIGPDGGWAVAGAWNEEQTQHTAFFLRWDGRVWRTLQRTDRGVVLNGIAAINENAAWAVGSRRDGYEMRMVIERWDGRTWREAPTPDLGTTYESLEGIVAIGPSDVWAVGSSSRGPITLHWDGSEWSEFSGGGGKGITTIAPNVLWAVGFGALQMCPLLVTDGGIHPASSGSRGGADVAVSFPETNKSTHGVRQLSGLGLFDSGRRSPGSSYTFSLPGPGSYPIVDPRNGSTATIEAVPGAFPDAGYEGTEYLLRLAQDDQPEGFVVDVRLRRPGSTPIPWRTAVTEEHLTFTPDVGPGTYSFEARTRHPSTGRSSEWSRGLVISVRRAQRSPCGPEWSAIPNQSGARDARLASVDVVGETKAWAVGQIGGEERDEGEPLIQRWDGRAWNLSQPPPDLLDVLLSVSGSSDRNVWAVGRRRVIQWNGERWDRLEGPFAGAQDVYYDEVEVLGERDVWIAAVIPGGDGYTKALARWTSAGWTEYESPGEGETNDMVATSPEDVWMVGNRYEPSSSSFSLQILHWDGTALLDVSPHLDETGEALLYGVTAVSETAAWAVGSEEDPETRRTRPLVLRWNGGAWERAAVPEVEGSLLSVTARSVSDAWAVGYTSFHDAPLVMHWDGERWDTVAVPDPGGWTDWLSGVDVFPDGRLAAVGATTVQYETENRALTMHACP